MSNRTRKTPLLALTILILVTAVAQTHAWRNNKYKRRNNSNNNKSFSSSQTDIHKSYGNGKGNGVDDRDKYSSLPHTVFSPQGRLYNVEKAAQLSSDENDSSSSLVLAFKFGGVNDNDNDNNNNNDTGESILVVSTSSISPYLHIMTKSQKENQEEETKQNERQNNNNNDNDENENEIKIRESLWKHNVYTIKEEDPSSSSSLSTTATPISILSPNIIIGTGGNAIDSIILQTKIFEIYLSLLKSNDNMNSTHRIKGIVLSSLVARKIADSLQVPTQNIGVNSGKILSSSALVVGMNEKKNKLTSNTQNQKYHNTIWRIDPTGQFWNCDAAAVGRGAGLVEGAMLRYVRKWKFQKDQKINCDDGNDNDKYNDNDNDNDDNNDDNNDDIDTLITSITNTDVKNCFESMTFDDAIKFAIDCICKVHKIHNKNDIEKVGIEGILIPSVSTIVNTTSGSSGKVSKPEMIHPGIIKGCLNTLVSH